MNQLPARGNPNMRPGAPSVNPKGRGPTNRQKIAERLISDLADTWSTHGAAVLRHLATEDPGKFATIAFGLLPRDVFVSVQQATPGGLSADEYAQLRGVLDAIEAAKLGDVDPAEIFAGIETYLKGSFAKTIEHEPLSVSPPPY